MYSFICISNKALCSIPNHIGTYGLDQWLRAPSQLSLTALFDMTHTLLHRVLIMAISNVSWINLGLPVDCFIVCVTH